MSKQVNYIELKHRCINCDVEIDMKVYPGTEAFTSGEVEDCYPAEDEKFEPTECPDCCKFIYLDDLDDLSEKFADAWADRHQQDGDYAYDQLKEEGRAV